MKEEKSEEKPATSALEYLKTGRVEVARRYLWVERVMRRAGLYDKTSLDRLRRYTARDMFRYRYVAYASRYWGNIEIEAALKELNVYGHGPITKQSLDEAKESMRVRERKK